MKDEDLAPHIGKSVSLVIPIRRRISISTYGMLNFSKKDGDNPEIYYWLPGEASTIFYITDVKSVEVSELLGIVIRLF